VYAWRNRLILAPIALHNVGKKQNRKTLRDVLRHAFYGDNQCLQQHCRNPGRRFPTSRTLAPAQFGRQRHTRHRPERVRPNPSTFAAARPELFDRNWNPSFHRRAVSKANFPSPQQHQKFGTVRLCRHAQFAVARFVEQQIGFDLSRQRLTPNFASHKNPLVCGPNGYHVHSKGGSPILFAQTNPNHICSMYNRTKNPDKCPTRKPKPPPLPCCSRPEKHSDE
ncbi:conserved hypothetical protein, partial [Trichinella spiralis]|uniref:hypothetical protein n=1 Tax=Trichinella spiralis TaxID=6334 RepID=UPI0001EFD6BA